MFKVFAVALLAIAPPNNTCSTLFPSFSDWSDENNKVYAPTERDYRESVYYKNLEKISAHNEAGHSWTMGVNKFADLTADEFGALYFGSFKPMKRNIRSGLQIRYELNETALPVSVDWTTKGAVTAVKNQEQCGSCWSFSTTGSTEGAWFLKNGTLVSLSEQQLVDCSVPEGNQGCNGGLMDYAFEYIIKNKGITTEAEYPYTATGPNTCVSKGKSVAATLSGYTDVPVNSETALMTAIAKQPVSVAVEADQSVFQFYKDGVMDSTCGTQLDHGVLAVGYGTDSTSGKDYYLVKNSWGADWGAKGYIMLARGAKFNPAGQCGIQMAASYPIV